jgi:hypothetical protein
MIAEYQYNQQANHVCGQINDGAWSAGRKQSNQAAYGCVLEAVGQFAV